ncbi:hypothetical protein Bbelb_195770 [Branchiostoma belcheri]|nr:hypothetical protein Bbelb_195770 [Branchiostoma belcheri]
MERRVSAPALFVAESQANTDHPKSTETVAKTAPFPMPVYGRGTRGENVNGLGWAPINTGVGSGLEASIDGPGAAGALEHFTRLGSAQTLGSDAFYSAKKRMCFEEEDGSWRQWDKNTVTWRVPIISDMATCRPQIDYLRADAHVMSHHVIQDVRDLRVVWVPGPQHARP